MEEKERYYSLIDNNGNFELRDYGSNRDIHSLYELDDLLNQQDKRIKELELLLNADKKMKTNSVKGFEKLRQENQELKQSQNQLAINELNEILNFIVNGRSNYYKQPFEIKKYIEDRIKSLKGEKNEL